MRSGGYGWDGMLLRLGEKKSSVEGLLDGVVKGAVQGLVAGVSSRC